MFNKSDMVKALAKRTAMTQAQADAAFDAFIEILSDELKQGEKVQFIGFGSFEVRKRAARISRNPRTGAQVKVPASKYVGFSVGKKLKEAVQDKPAKGKKKSS